MKISPPYKVEESTTTSLGKTEIICKDQDFYILFEDEKLNFLSAFLYWWRNPDDIKDTLLPEIKSVVDGLVEFTDIGADVIGLAYIEREVTKLIGSDVGYPDIELPTVGFNEIVLKWLEFLESQGS